MSVQAIVTNAPNQLISIPKSAVYQGSNLHFLSDRSGKGEVKVLARQEFQDVSGYFIKLNKPASDGSLRYGLRINFQNGEEAFVMVGPKCIKEGLCKEVNDSIHFVATALSYTPNADTTKEGTFSTVNDKAN